MGPAFAFGAPCNSTSMSLFSSKSSLGATAFVVFGVVSVMTLKELNIQVTEPYMVCLPFCIRYIADLTC